MPEARGSGREELSHIRGQGWQPRVPGCDRAGAAERGATPRPRPGAAAWKSNPMPEARAVTGRSNPTPKTRGGGREEPHNVQGVVAAWAQEGLEEPPHVEGQEGRW